MLNQKHKPPIVQSLLTYFFKLLQLLCSTLTFIWFRGIRTNWNLIIISTSTPPPNRLQCSRSPCNTSKPRQAGYRCLYFTNTVCEQLMNEAKTILSNLHICKHTRRIKNPVWYSHGIRRPKPCAQTLVLHYGYTWVSWIICVYYRDVITLTSAAHKAQTMICFPWSLIVWHVRTQLSALLTHILPAHTIHTQITHTHKVHIMN